MDKHNNATSNVCHICLDLVGRGNKTCIEDLKNVSHGEASSLNPRDSFRGKERNGKANLTKAMQNREM